MISSMEQSPSWEADSHSASHEIHRRLWNPKVNCRVHKNSQQVPILIQMHPLRIFLSYFSNIHPNVIFPSTPRSSEWSLPFRYSDQKIVCIFVSNISLRIWVSNPKVEDHPLSATRNCLFSIFASTLRVWRPSPPSTTREHVLPWWQGAT
jgi:hypothetical protein